MKSPKRRQKSPHAISNLSRFLLKCYFKIYNFFLTKMYNPSRGGVRGGADQFTWESVKNDKHRENYLGHSLKAPVGRWQKGKDLSWYAKERKDGAESSDKSELASIKRAEEEAMLIALGHNIVRKTQTLSKEDMQEALKRNIGDRDENNIERMDGVGASSQRVALLSGAKKVSRLNSEGVSFEGYRQKNKDVINNREMNEENIDDDRKRNKKKSKKQNKEKKHKKHKDSRDSDSSTSTSKYRTKSKKRKFDNDKKSSLIKSHKKSKNSNKDYSSDDLETKYHSNKKRYKKQNDTVKRRRHDTSESD